MSLFELFHHPSQPPIDLRDIAGHLLKIERIIMSQADELQALQTSVATLTQAAADEASKARALAGKVDSLIALTDSIKAQLAAGAADGSIPAGTLSALTTSIDSAVASIQGSGAVLDAEGAKVDAETAVSAPAPVDGSTPTA